MQTYINRITEKIIKEDLKNFPVVTILGSRQCGKSTIAKKIGEKIKNFIYLDLEKPSDLRKIDDPEFFFKLNADKVICLDEIQLKEDLFPILRSVIDENRTNGKFIILGSASRDLIEKSSESLAGRISFIDLTPFTISELKKSKDFEINKFWLRGGYPDSYLVANHKISLRWRENFIKTYIERDLPQLGLNISPIILRRFLTMIAHIQGQLINYQKISQSLGVDYHTLQRYLNIFEQSFTIRKLDPYFGNIKKRLVKSSKVYIRDSGILHSLLDIENINSLMGNPLAGNSWEGMIVENIIIEMNTWKSYFYRTSSGNELDLVLEKGGKTIAIEMKLSLAPNVSKGFWEAISDINASEAWIIAPVEKAYQIKENVFVSNLEYFLAKMKNN